MEKEPINFICLAYRFKKRLSISLPYWLSQNIVVNICTIKDDPDGTRKAIFDLSTKYPGRIKLHTFDLDPFQRALMYHDVINKVTTEYCAFFDLDLIPPPNLVVELRKVIIGNDGITVPRANLPNFLVNKVLERKISGYNKIREEYIRCGHNGLRKTEKGCFYGYLQMGRTEAFQKAVPHIDHIGVDIHDVTFKEKLIKNGGQIKTREKFLLLHLTHPQNHTKNVNSNL